MKDDYPPVNIKKAQQEKYYEALEISALEGDIKPFAKLVESTMDKELDDLLQMYKKHLNLSELDQQDKNLFKLAKSIKEQALKR